MAENIVKQCVKCPTWVISMDGKRDTCPKCNSTIK
jgi:hypothetical protein